MPPHRSQTPDPIPVPDIAEPGSRPIAPTLSQYRTSRRPLASYAMSVLDIAYQARRNIAQGRNTHPVSARNTW
eukprot:3055203-Rhodomonas_salina.4